MAFSFLYARSMRNYRHNKVREAFNARVFRHFVKTSGVQQRPFFYYGFYPTFTGLFGRFLSFQYRANGLRYLFLYLSYLGVNFLYILLRGGAIATFLAGAKTIIPRVKRGRLARTLVHLAMASRLVRLPLFVHPGS